MPATPAWPPSSLPRLFVDQHLAEGAISLSGPAAHYLSTVLRLKPGSKVKLFDDRTGEWLARVEAVAKKSLDLQITNRLRERESAPDVWLLFAPIKKGRLDWIVEKATELGAARILPVVTHRTIVDKPNMERLRAHAIEAAEQCERTGLPDLAEPAKLASLLSTWPSDRTLYFADEAGGEPFGSAAADGPAAILIGPEGGFTDEERGSITALPSAKAISLGPRILRADTAAVAALSVWMARAGDWSRHAVR